MTFADVQLINISFAKACTSSRLLRISEHRAHLTISISLMSQSIPTGYIPPGNPRGLAQKACPGVSGFDFRKLPGDREFDKDRDYVENKIEASKNSVDQIFTGKNKKTKKACRIFDLFRGLRVFSIEIFLVYGSIFWFYYHTYLNKKI